MFLPHEQDPEAVLSRLAPLTPVLYRAVEAGIAESLDFFKSRDQPVDTSLLPNIVRWKAKHILDEAGHAARIEDETVTAIGVHRFERIPIANNGLQISYAGFFLRVLKTDGGGVPVAGPSIARQDFYHQLTLFGEAVEILKLLVLWDADLAGLVGDLLLVCPRRGGATRDSLEVHWTAPIPHPAERASPPLNPARDATDDDDGLYRLPSQEEEERQDR